MNFIERDVPQQDSDGVIDITEWQPHEESHIYPIGARVKELKYAPDDCDNPLCIGGHRYLFKHSWERYPEQYWAEIVAFRIGKLMQLPVPPSFAAIDSAQDIPGSLSEWFYGYEGSTERYVTGGDFMQALVDDFDPKKGTKHNFEAVTFLCRALAQNPTILLEDNWTEYWAFCLLFDTVIGNTDRHQDNWGLLVKFEEGNPKYFRFAPYFDNGTSLGHEIDPVRQKRMMEDNAHLMRYVRRGTHHMRKSVDSNRISHVDFMEAFSLSTDTLLNSMRSKLEFDDAAVEAELYPLTEIVTKHPFTKERARFVTALISCRRDNLIRKIDEIKQ